MPGTLMAGGNCAVGQDPHVFHGSEWKYMYMKMLNTEQLNHQFQFCSCFLVIGGKTWPTCDRNGWFSKPLHCHRTNVYPESRPGLSFSSWQSWGICAQGTVSNVVIDYADLITKIKSALIFRLVIKWLEQYLSFSQQSMFTSTASLLSPCSDV